MVSKQEASSRGKILSTKAIYKNYVIIPVPNPVLHNAVLVNGRHYYPSLVAATDAIDARSQRATL